MIHHLETQKHRSQNENGITAWNCSFNMMGAGMRVVDTSGRTPKKESGGRN